MSEQEAVVEEEAKEEEKEEVEEEPKVAKVVTRQKWAFDRVVESDGIYSWEFQEGIERGHEVVCIPHEKDGEKRLACLSMDKEALDKFEEHVKGPFQLEKITLQPKAPMTSFAEIVSAAVNGIDMEKNAEAPKQDYRALIGLKEAVQELKKTLEIQEIKRADTEIKKEEG